MISELVNADFSKRVVIATNDLPWTASPQAGVERRLLDRIGTEVARATSVVRYAPASAFPAHDHALGEEFLVLDGIFSDEYGDYPVGTYVRNPPGSHHSPRTMSGCIILVKLRQMVRTEQNRIVIDTTDLDWKQSLLEGHAIRHLYSSDLGGERVTLERLGVGVKLPQIDCPGGEEIFVLSGDLADELGVYGSGTWIRNPAGYRRSFRSKGSVTYWAKRGHLHMTPGQ